MNRDRRDKKKSNKKSDGEKSKLQKFIISPLGKFIGITLSIITTLGLVDQYNKHVDLDVELSSIVHIIVEGDKIPAPNNFEASRWVLHRIDKKLAFIRSSQRSAHLNSFSLHYPRFTNIDSFTALGSLRSASQSFRQIEKDNHKNYASLEAQSNWIITLKKFEDSEKYSVQSLATAPIKLLAQSRFFDKEISTYLRSTAGEVKGIYTNNPPKPLAATYPVLDLASNASTKAYGAVTPQQPRGRYFIPAYNELTDLEKASGSKIFKEAQDIR